MAMLGAVLSKAFNASAATVSGVFVGAGDGSALLIGYVLFLLLVVFFLAAASVTPRDRLTLCRSIKQVLCSKPLAKVDVSKVYIKFVRHRYSRFDVRLSVDIHSLFIPNIPSSTTVFNEIYRRSQRNCAFSFLLLPSELPLRLLPELVALGLFFALPWGHGMRHEMLLSTMTKSVCE